MCIIVEDEPAAIQKLSSFIEKIEYLHLTACFQSVAEALNWLNQHTVDLIFLDLHLGEAKGFDLLKSISYSPHVIVTTAFSEYAVESYQYYIDAYLLKPYSFSDFLQAISKIYKSSTYIGSKKDYIFIKTEYRLEKVLLNDILYLEGMKDYIKIVMTNKQLMTLMNFKEIIELLDSQNFYRVHHSFVVAIDKIDFIERNRIVINEQYIPISESKRVNFLKFINK